MERFVDNPRPRFDVRRVEMEGTPEHFAYELLFTGALNYLLGDHNLLTPGGGTDEFAKKIKQLGQETIELSGKLIAMTYDIDTDTVGTLIDKTAEHVEPWRRIAGLADTIALHLAEGVYKADMQELAVDIADQHVTHPQVIAELPEHLRRPATTQDPLI